ncbi:hybrid sensor histidine kinase/response regulator [Chitinivibrio alkaliphilus]|uniref:histidine kinase n=1 Tax=Chitinivibrio alkaliphilus ACht1 TaxID=1313304 RepID=U7D6U9_9BACT|nr:response regulator [Chitinivibrio alkaliphilus]ERP38690.1 PAS/PAC sensor hybrid histidine kinase [Chitinivibrio alkaliphilus ACht1]
MRNRLQFKLVLLLSLFSIFSTVIVSGIEIRNRYVRGLDDIQAELQNLMETHGATLGQNLWRFDEPSIQLQMESMANSPSVVGVKISDLRGGIRTYGDREDHVDELSVSGNIYHVYQDPPVHVGDIALFGTEESLRKTILRDIPGMVIGELGRTITLAVFFLGLFYVLFGKHMRTIMEYVETFDVENSPAKIVLKRNGFRRGTDELDRLVDALEKMASRIKHDLLMQKQAEQEIQQREEDLRVTLASIGDAVVTTDMAGCITRMNPVAERLTGESFKEVEGTPFDEVFHLIHAHTRERVVSPIDTVISQGKTQSIERNVLIVSRHGQEYHIGDSAAPIRAASGEVMGAVVVFHDMSEEVALQEKLNQSQKMDALGQLSGGIAHDFNNILGGILGAAELLTSEDLSREERENYAELIRTTADRGAGLTRKLLSFSRKGDAEKRQMEVVSLVEETEEILERTLDKSIDITVQNTIGSSVYINGDETLLQNALINLGINASHAMPRGGALQYRVSIVSLDAAYCEKSTFSLSPGEYVEIAVRDTGCGMSSAVQQRIFEPFFTTKEMGKGTGLGLSAVYGAMQDHGGAVTVYSEEGVGTVFRLYFPRVLLTGEVRDTSEKVVHGAGLLLVIDDDEIMRYTATAMLESLGYEVVSAQNGLEGLQLFQREPETFDLVLLDMIMPVMGGRDTFERLRRVRQDIKIIISSGFSRDEALQSLYLQGLDGFISKPFNRVELSRMVAAVLQRTMPNSGRND